jgi:integrase
MAGKLNNLMVPRLGVGNHSDGDGLYLRVIGASRTWAFRYQRQGKTHWLSLGRVADFTLAEARQKARDFRRKLHDGVDVAAERKAARVAPAPGLTFGQVATDYIEAFKAGWKPKQAGLWRTSLDQHAVTLLARPVAAVNVHDVMAVLDPIWRTKNETASKVRGRIEAILTYARAKELRHGDNPAEWRGRLKALLPDRSDVQTVVHHAALAWQDVPATMAALNASQGTAAACVAFLILTATRSAEARGTQWSEIDMANATWTIPAERMKSGKEHRVPLAVAALAILAVRQSARRLGAGLVFEGGVKERPLSDVGLSKALHTAAGRSGVTVHGCRSSFRDWCGEVATVPSEIAEAALAHTNPDKTERAYARSDLFEKRRELMADWAEHCTVPAEAEKKKEAVS